MSLQFTSEQIKRRDQKVYNKRANRYCQRHGVRDCESCAEKLRNLRPPKQCPKGHTNIYVDERNIRWRCRTCKNETWRRMAERRRAGRDPVQRGLKKGFVYNDTLRELVQAKMRMYPEEYTANEIALRAEFILPDGRPDGSRVMAALGLSSERRQSCREDLAEAICRACHILPYEAGI